jgi:mannose-6-phosphate isomerase
MEKAAAPFDRVSIDRIEKPWGYELIWARTERYVGKILHVRAGESLSLQYHEKKEETLFLTRGSVLLTLRNEDEERVIEMKEGDSFHIPPRLIHRIEAREDSDITEVSTTELDDVVRLEDRYGRTAEREQ